MAKFFSDGYGSGLLSGLASTISGIWGTIQQNKNVDKQIAAARQENAQARDYNLRLAKLQNAWNVAQWHRENEYNSPQAAMGRFRSAGLNPDLIYGGASNLGSASSPSLTAGAPASPADVSALGQKRTVGDAVQQGLRDSLLGAQVALVNAQTGKTKEDTKGQAITNETLGAMNRWQLIRYADDHNLSGQEFRNLVKTNEIMSQQIEEMKLNLLTLAARYENLPNELLLQNLQSAWNILKTKSEKLKIDKETDDLIPAQIASLMKSANTADWPTVISNFFKGVFGIDGKTTPEVAENAGKLVRETIKGAVDELDKRNKPYEGGFKEINKALPSKNLSNFGLPIY